MDIRMTEQEYRDLEAKITEKVLQEIETKKHSKSTFRKIIDEFNDDYTRISGGGKRKDTLKTSIAGLARVHFKLGHYDIGFNAEQSDELRQFIRSTLDSMKGKEK